MGRGLPGRRLLAAAGAALYLVSVLVAHPEAVVRLEAMWRAWEKMRREDPLAGIAKWFVEIGDPMMRELLDPDGPFKGCNETRHREKSEDMSLPTVPLGVLP